MYTVCRVFELIYKCTETSSQIVMEVIHESEFASTYIPGMINNGLGIDYKNLSIFLLYHTLYSFYRKCENTYCYGVKHRWTIKFDSGRYCCGSEFCGIRNFLGKAGIWSTVFRIWIRNRDPTVCDIINSSSLSNLALQSGVTWRPLTKSFLFVQTLVFCNNNV